MSFGNHSITKQTFDLIKEILPSDKIILELGSGYGTEALANYGYKLYSVEHNKGWMWKYNSNYIHCPLTNQESKSEFDQWYDIDSIISELPKEYDLLLVDGPPSDFRRTNFIHHLTKFNKKAIWVFDDLQREYDLITYKKVCEARNLKEDIRDCGQKLVGLCIEEN
jgi:hypothetical protein